MNVDFLLKGINENAEKAAIITREKVFTFNDIYNEYKKCENEFDKCGLGEGKIVSVVADFSPVSVALLLALIRRNCILVPVSSTIKHADKYAIISEAEYRISMKNDSFVVDKIGCSPVHTLLSQLIKKNLPGLILFSSGTTGEPKAALHDLSMLLEKFTKPGKVFRTITFLLFDHIGGFNTLMHAMANGGTIVTVNSRSVDDVCSVIENHKVELLPTSPTFLNMMLLSRAYEKYDLSSLKIISYGTEPMAESTLVALNSLLPNTVLKQTYGLSELGIMSTKSESSGSLWLKLGGDGFETKIVDGILHIRAKSAMLGYLNAASPFDDEQWFNTKDKVEVKGEFIKILGRTTDIINVGGEKVYPIEVESVLLRCEGVKDARVFGLKNPIVGSMIVAEILVEPENNNREFIKKLRVFCVENLEKFKVPAKFNLEIDSLYGDRLKKMR